MKESHAQIRRFLKEFWWEMGRWILLLFIIGSVLLTAVLWWAVKEYPFVAYFILFWVCFSIAWFFMFRRKPKQKEFEGDA